jgi:hypothetical protein
LIDGIAAGLSKEPLGAEDHSLREAKTSESHGSSRRRHRLILAQA